MNELDGQRWGALSPWSSVSNVSLALTHPAASWRDVPHPSCWVPVGCFQRPPGARQHDVCQHWCPPTTATSPGHPPHAATLSPSNWALSPGWGCPKETQTSCPNVLPHQVLPWSKGEPR